MKNSLSYILLILIASFGLNAQNNIVVEVNYNTFSHSKLKNFQQELSSDIEEVNLRTNDEFGANIGFQIGLKIDKLNTQFFASYNSTGGKSSYSDYSGSIRLTQLVTVYSLGGEYQINLSNNPNKKSVFFGIRGFLNYTQLDVSSYSKISNTVSNESIDFNSIDLGLGLRFNYDIPISVVKLRLNLGYDLVLGGNLKFKENSDYTLENNQGDPIKSGWSGFRSGIGIVIPF